MYKIIKIGGNDYKFEYTIEASLYQDFVEKITSFIADYSGTIAKYDWLGEDIKTKDDVARIGVGAIKDMLVSQTTQVPILTITGFYAGLLEHHKLTFEEAKELYKTYLKEYNKKPAEVLSEILEKVQEDNFFDLIGLDMTKITNPQNIKEKKVSKKS